MAKNSKETFMVELHDGDGWQDTPVDNISTYAEAVELAKQNEWLDKKRDNYAIIVKRTEVAQVERPDPVAIKL